MDMWKTGFSSVDLLAVAAGLVVAVPFILVIAAPSLFGY